MSDQGRNWIVRGADGRIVGPFVTSQVLRKIEHGEFSGDEWISLHPGGNWIPISKAPEFYDKLLDVLASEANEIKSGGRRSMRTVNQPTGKQADDQATVFPTRRAPSRGRVVRETKDDEIKFTGASQPPASITQPDSPASSAFDDDDDEPDVIELKDLKQLAQETKKQNIKLPLILIAVALALVAIAYFARPEVRLAQQQIRLLAPRKGMSALSTSEVAGAIKRGQFAFQQDTFGSYIKAQSEFLKAVEGSPRTAEAYSRLCLAYRELWPFTRQDAEDLNTFSSVTQAAKALEPGGFHGATCEIAYLLAASRPRDARQLTENWISVQTSAPVLYEITADLGLGDRNFIEAQGYAANARTLWPQWLKPYVLEARARAGMRDFANAMALYQLVLKANPKHQVARIEVAILEMQQFNQNDKAFELLQSAIDSGEKIPREIEFKAFLALAVLHEKRSSQSRALSFAKRAYALNPNHPQVRELLSRLGAADQLNTKPGGRERMYRGDEYVKAGDHLAAQAEYRAAFDVDPKNATAALKAAKSLWQLNQSAEAIDWLNKATRSDPKFIQAYTTLADYYSQRFDYMAAVTTLRNAQRVAPKSFEVYRGFAQVELRRNNFKVAADSAKRALDLYSADVETYVIMANAQVGLGNFPDAQRFAQRAVELDQTNIEAQGAYAKILLDLQGISSALTYTDSLITSYPQIVDYRVAKAEILLREERFAEATQVFREARSLAGRNKRAALGLGKALQAQNQNQDALRSFLEAAEMDPSDANPLFLAGNLYADNMGKQPEAVRMYERVLRLNPRFPRAHVQMGWAFLRQNDAEAALKQSAEERKMNPDLADAYILAAESHFAQKRYSNCAAEYQGAVARGLATTLIYVKMARCYRLSGSLDSAISLLNQAKDRENGNPEVYKELGATYHVRGMGEEALSAYQQYLNLSPGAADRQDIEGYMQKIRSGDLSF